MVVLYDTTRSCILALELLVTLFFTSTNKHAVRCCLSVLLCLHFSWLFLDHKRILKMKSLNRNRML
jgi:hypothetical protein